MATFTPILRKKYASDSHGIINIRATINRKSKYHSLAISIPVNFWLSKSKVVKSTYPNANEINDLIANRVIELKLFNKSIADIGLISTSTKSSYLNYHKKHIDFLLSNNDLGSHSRFNVVYSHLKRFTESNQKTDISFQDINLTWLNSFNDYLRKRNLKESSRNVYIQAIQALYRKALKEDLFQTIKDPFLSYVFRVGKTSKDFLSTSQITNLINANIQDPIEQEARNHFLTQIYAQGIRISDLLTLRYSNIDFDDEDSRINFTMLKTKDSHSINLTIDLLRHLIFYIDRDFFNEIYTKKRFEVSINNVNVDFTYPQLVNYERTRKYILRETDPDIAIDYDESHLDNIGKYHQSMFNEMYNIILNYAMENPNAFLVPLSDENRFKDVDFNSNTSLNKAQYFHLKYVAYKYNLNLKSLNKHVKYIKPITSHLARATYANLLLTNNVDVYSISKLLGHQKLATTESYISGFNLNRIDKDHQKAFNTLSI